MPDKGSTMLRHFWLPIVLCTLSGCSVNVDGAPIKELLPKLAAQFGADKQALLGSLGNGANGGPVPSSEPTAGTCANGAAPAAGTMVGDSLIGDYAGVVLPASFAAYQAEQDVTDRITRFSQDTSGPGRGTWVNFRCLFAKAVTVWNGKRQQTLRLPGSALATPVPYAPLAPYVPPVPFAPTAAPAAPMAIATPDTSAAAQDTSAAAPDASAATPDASAATPGCRTDIDPANGTSTGTDAVGDYNGVTLPGSFSVYGSEQAVTDRIGTFAADTTATGINTWASFQCFYGKAVAVWRTK
jgi:hypothetical protein